ncbi:hypothetical protein FLONG3_1610 [Fusarium longipes]|uniref:Uncharacterized protein n=1 Tax=Fusarium longipes TaxID=694270 RepID=A0A395T7A7_9HYPO|nr:hypothetical protein FLONG3_1610 [Fusarium longipes]
MASSHNFGDPTEVEFKNGVEREVAAFLRRLESFCLDDEIEDVEAQVPTIDNELYKPYRPGALHEKKGNTRCNPGISGPSAPFKQPGATTNGSTRQTDNGDCVSHQIQNYLEIKEVSKRQRELGLQVSQLEESLAELDSERKSLLDEAEIKRLSYSNIDGSVDVEMGKVLERYRLNGMERNALEAKCQEITEEIRRLGKSKRQM